jgi:hypothetical protein
MTEQRYMEISAHVLDADGIRQETGTFEFRGQDRPALVAAVDAMLAKIEADPAPHAIVLTITFDGCASHCFELEISDKPDGLPARVLT